MNKSESIKSLAEALSKAQAKLKNPHFDSVNPHFKSKFASLGAVRESVIPVFAEHGLALTQWPISEEGKAGCLTHVSHASGEWMCESFLIPVDKHNAHGYASAVTYSKRIAMQSIAGVVGDEDDDGNQAVGDNVKGERRITPTGGVWESLSVDMQNHLSDIAHRAHVLLTKGDVAGAWDEITEQDEALDADHKVALWTRFDSKERSALKKEAERRKQPVQHKEAA